MKKISLFIISALFIFTVSATADDTQDFMGAAEKGNLKTVMNLLKKNPSLVNSKDADFGRTGLMRAAENGYMDITEFLLSNGASVDLKDKDGMTALIYAAMWNHTSVAELLISKGADINVKDKAGMTPLLYAASNGHRDTVIYLISKKADITVKDNTGKTPLKWAQEGGYSEVAEVLKNKGAKE